MEITNVNKKIAILACILCVFMLISGSLVNIGCNHIHIEEHEGCTICTMVNNIEKTLKNLIALFIILLICNFSLFVTHLSNKTYFISTTLVDCNVQMNE